MIEIKGTGDAWSMIIGAAVGAAIAIVVGPPLVGGVVIGLCLGLLFSPKTGSETRRSIGGWGKGLGERLARHDVPAPKAAAIASSSAAKPLAEPRKSEPAIEVRSA
jgi:hypothetical protein